MFIIRFVLPYSSAYGGLYNSLQQSIIRFMKHKRNQRGFHHIPILLFILVIVAIGLIGYKVVKSHHSTINNSTQPSVNKVAKQTQNTGSQTKTKVLWQRGEGGVWHATSTPPACPAQPMMATPVDLSLATSIIYPGQVRGNAFKPHGGFRFDNQPNNDIKVTVPMDAQVLRGAKGNFPDAGEVQYSFEFMAPCGIWYSFGHLHTLSPQFLAYADKLPVISDFSQQQLYDIPGNPSVKKGDVIATQVGIIHTKNVSTELVVEDVRQPNGKTIRPAWAQYADQFDKYGVCWLDWFPPADAALAHSLPGGDSVAGKQSDYCN